MIYLDYASTTPVDPVVLAAMQPYFDDRFYNPSALYTAARRVKQDYEAARAQCAELLAVRSSEIVFVAGSSEANNLAIKGVMAQYPEASMVLSAIEHDSVLRTAARATHRVLPVDKQGIVKVDVLPKLIDDTTVLVSCMLVNNEVGTIQPMHEIGREIARIRTERLAAGNTLPLLLHCDASQAFNYLAVLPHKLGVDLLVMGGSKVYGPKQSALLYVRAGLQLQPLIDGGGQEWGLRSGTENVAAVLGLTTALQRAAQMRQAEQLRLSRLKQDFTERLMHLLPDVQLNGSPKHQLPNFVHLTIPDVDNERLVMQLDELGIMVATGSACHASSDQPSHVLAAMGLPAEAIQNSIRISMGRGTTAQQLDATLVALRAILLA